MKLKIKPTEWSWDAWDVVIFVGFGLGVIGSLVMAELANLLYSTGAFLAYALYKDMERQRDEYAARYREATERGKRWY